MMTRSSFLRGIVAALTFILLVAATTVGTVTFNNDFSVGADGSVSVAAFTGDVTKLAGGTATTLAAGSASALNSGTLAAGRLPALTGDVTTSAGSAATTLAAGSASNLNSGTLPAGRLPALTGDVTSSAGSAATTLAAGSASVLNSGTLPAGRLPALTGDVTSSAGSAATTLAAGSASVLSSGTLPQARLPTPATPATIAAQNPTGTSSTASRKLMGLGGTATITPTRTGKVLIVANFRIANSNGAGAGGIGQIYYGTGTAPANGDAVSGTAVGTVFAMTAPSAGAFETMSLTAVVTGLTLSTAYWVDLGIAATSAGTLTVSEVVITLIELSP